MPVCPHSASTDLPSMLRAAVDAIHAQPLPFGALSDAMERAKRLEGPTMTRGRKYSWRQMAMAAAVAAIVLGPMLLAALRLDASRSDDRQPSAGEHIALVAKRDIPQGTVFNNPEEWFVEKEVADLGYLGDVALTFAEVQDKVL